MQQQEILASLETIVDGRLPDKPAEKFEHQSDVLKEASDAELERLLADPALHQPENIAIRNEVVGILTDRTNPKRVNKLLEDIDVKQVETHLSTTQSEDLSTDKTAAERARTAFSDAGCPLADLIPDEVRHFIIDPDGTFYLEFEELHQHSMSDFELVLEQVVSGRIENNTLHSINGIWAKKDVNFKTVKIQFTEMLFEGERISIKTNHPLAPVVHMYRAEFMVLT